jgi:acylphosphatase
MKRFLSSTATMSSKRVRARPRRGRTRANLVATLDFIQSRRRGPGCQLQVPSPVRHPSPSVDATSRSFTQKQAKSIGVTGFVTNASDGSVGNHHFLPCPRADSVQVQGEAQGSDDAIKQFVQHLNKGPSAASVAGVEHSEISTKSGESDFNVK